MSFSNEIWLAIRSDVADGGGDGSPANPFVVNTPTSFADIMASDLKVPPGSLVRLMPGIYRTRGSLGDGYLLMGL